MGHFCFILIQTYIKYTQKWDTPLIAEKVKMYLTSRIPMGKLGSAEDISSCVAFLSSDQASYITGETIHVNGGMYMS